MATTTYSTGTVTVAAGSTTVTGVGTGWSASGIRAGDMFILSGLSAPIASVDSAAQLTLSDPWPGIGASGSTYHVMLLDDAAQTLIAANQVYASLTGGNLLAFVGLESSADTIAYFTGTGTMALADFPQAARDWQAPLTDSTETPEPEPADDLSVTFGAGQITVNSVDEPSKALVDFGAEQVTITEVE